MVLEHDDLILLARLLGNHLTGTRGPLVKVADKLMAYAERMGEWDMYDNNSLRPLDLKPASAEFYPGRTMFHEDD